jgi:hypothetical protein
MGVGAARGGHRTCNAKIRRLRMPYPPLMDKNEAKVKAEKKAEEQITLARRDLWLLKIAAATGIMSFISHGISAVTWFLTHTGII